MKKLNELQAINSTSTLEQFGHTTNDNGDVYLDMMVDFESGNLILQANGETYHTMNISRITDTETLKSAIYGDIAEDESEELLSDMISELMINYDGDN